MNILFLSELIYPHGSGAELATGLYADLLSKADCKVTVVTNRFAEESRFSKTGSLTIYRLPLFERARAVKYSVLKRFDILFSDFLRTWIKWADVVYIPRFWFAAIPLVKAYGKPVVTHLHDYIPVCPLSSLHDESLQSTCNRGNLSCALGCIYSFEKSHEKGLGETLVSTVLNFSVGRLLTKTIDLSDAVVCVSETQKEIIVAKERFLREKTYVVYNPVPDFADVDICGSDFGYFGGQDSLKGFQVLYKALAHLVNVHSRSIKIHATKFQNTRDSDSRLLSQLGFLLHGKLNEQEFIRVYRLVQTVLVPSVWNEPWPYVVVQALTQKRLVVASQVGGIPEQVEGCKGVFLCQSSNYQQLADAIDSVTNLNKEEIVDLGLQNKETFIKRFKNENTINKMVHIFESVI